MRVKKASLGHTCVICPCSMLRVAHKWKARVTILSLSSKIISSVLKWKRLIFQANETVWMTRKILRNIVFIEYDAWFLPYIYK